jgi:hypothetical protein
MKTAVEQLMTGDSIRFPLTDMNNYDSTKHNFGPVFYQGVDSWTGSKSFIGPSPIQVAKPMETSIACAAGFPHAIQIGQVEYAVVLAESGTANVLRRFLLYIYRADLGTMTYRGAISYTYATAATIRAIRLQRTITSTGTVAVSGTTVTGTGTDWFTKRINAGSRIGFGSTDPDQITTWYDITPGTALTTNATLTLLSSPGTIPAGTPYIIEDYSLIILATCATTSDGGGLRIIKGLSLSTACWSGTATATVIANATTIDNIRACYWLKNAATATIGLTGAGFALDTVSTDNLTQLAYVLDGASTTATISVYNIKAALTLTSGYATNPYQFVTGSPTTTGNVSQIHNCRIGTLRHGAGNGVKSLYFTTASRLYRCALSGITTGSTTFLNDMMLEVPPGGVNTIPASGAMSNLEIFDSLDRIGWFTTSATAFRSYMTQYRTDSSQMDHVWLGDSKIVHAGVSDITAYPYPNTSSTVMTSWGEGGFCFLARQGTTALLNQIYVVPTGAHWGYQNAAPYNVYITPAIQTPGASRYYRLCVNEAQTLGGDVLGVTPEGYKVYYRTGGIVDNSGAWTLLSTDFDMSGITAASAIQFKFEFKIFSVTCVPARLFSLNVIYEAQDDIPSSLRWNMEDSSSTDGTVGFIQSTTFSVMPTVLQFDYYRSDTNANVLTQLSSSTTNGVFEYYNGSSWVTGLGSNTVGIRRRFRPTAGLPNGVAVYPKITIIS